MTTPPLGRGSEDEALRELTRLARDLHTVDAQEAWHRLGDGSPASSARLVHAAASRVRPERL